MSNDALSAGNTVRAAKIETGPPLPSQRDNNTDISVMTYDTQCGVIIETGMSMEFFVSSGGGNNNNPGKGVEMEEGDGGK